MSDSEANVADVCRQLRRQPRHPDLTRLLRRVWELLQEVWRGRGRAPSLLMPTRAV